MSQATILANKSSNDKTWYSLSSTASKKSREKSRQYFIDETKQTQ